MHIFHSVYAYYPAQYGGPSNSIYWLAKALIRRGHRVSVGATVVGLPEGVARNCWNETEYGRVMYSDTSIPYLSFRQIRAAWSVLKKADVVHLNTLFLPSAYLIGLIAVVSGKKTVLSVRGELDPAALIYRTKLKKIMIWMLNKVSPKIHFHATCKEEVDYIRDHFPTTAGTFLIPNYMELPIRVERKPGNYLLYIGRLHPKKAIDRLIEAVGQSARFRQSDYILKIVGSPDKPGYTEQLQQQVSKLKLTGRVEFVGPVVGEAKQQLYADAFATFLPSHSENFGNVVIESMAQGTPVVASFGTPWQLLETHGAGFWVENSPEELSRVIDHLLSLSTEEYRLYRQSAYQLVVDQFDMESNVYKWEQQYQQIIAS
jgi:glycosyltransferase involved in cell wall biosynthesis